MEGRKRREREEEEKNLKKRKNTQLGCQGGKGKFVALGLFGRSCHVADFSRDFPSAGKTFCFFFFFFFLSPSAGGGGGCWLLATGYWLRVAGLAAAEESTRGKTRDQTSAVLLLWRCLGNRRAVSREAKRETKLGLGVEEQRATLPTGAGMRCSRQGFWLSRYAVMIPSAGLLAGAKTAARLVLPERML